mmetsp:Transcript_54663/g.142747  ORF Transcript_54663/g.142747 Transcript_54663/m.142747 type:complete len:214 (+) Transcript_54663:68-709(+)
MLGLLTSAASRVLSDTLTFGINLAVTTNMLQYVYGATLSQRCGVTPPLRRWGPFILIAAASVASMADISRQVVLDSKGAALVTKAGPVKAFDFDHCSYTASASPLVGMAASDGAPLTDTCVSEPLTVTQSGATGPEVDRWLRAPLCTKVCGLLSRAGLVLTIGGFLWLSEVMPWLQAKWKQVNAGGLAQHLLSTECSECHQRCSAEECDATHA